MNNNKEAFISANRPVVTVVVIPGDGIGPEVTEATLKVLKATNAPLDFVMKNAGEECLNATGSLLPEDTIEAIKTHKLALKGPTNTPVGTGHRSINVQLRKMFNLYANVRPVKNLPGVKSRYENVNLTIVRENTEDLYAGIERMIDENTAESIKIITKGASEKISRYALNYARERGLKEVIAIHKANIMKSTDGLFLRTFQSLAPEFKDLELKDLIVDNACQQLVTRPERYQVLVTENLYGDILSDLCAGLVGGLGVAPGANIGDDAAIFEAVHGSAPDIAKQNKANPTALMLSGVMMLRHLMMDYEANKLEGAIFKALSDSKVKTKDLGGEGSTTDFTNAVLKHLES